MFCSKAISFIWKIILVKCCKYWTGIEQNLCDICTGYPNNKRTLSRQFFNFIKMLWMTYWFKEFKEFQDLYWVFALLIEADALTFKRNISSHDLFKFELFCWNLNSPCHLVLKNADLWYDEKFGRGCGICAKAKQEQNNFEFLSELVFSCGQLLSMLSDLIFLAPTNKVC